MSSIPFPSGKIDFPFWTLIINFLGAVIIGVIAGNRGLGNNSVLFWKTGVCGGFTTFSAFSLEALELFEKSKTGHAALYIVLSVGLCLFGVIIGKYIASYIVK